MKNLWTSAPDDLDQPLQDQSWFFFGNVVSPTELSDYGTDEPFWVRSNGSKNLAPPIGNRALASARASAPSGPGSGADLPVTTVAIDGSSTQAVTFTGTTGTLKRKDAPYSPGSISGLAGADAVDIADISPVTIANGATADIDGPSAQSVAFTGTTGTVKLEDPQAFAGLVSGLSGADAIDLSGFAYGANVTATYLGNAAGGTLTVTDGTKTARVALSGNYLSSSWTLSSDGRGGTTVVDPNWQDLKVGGGGWVTGISIANDGTMVVRTDTNAAYLWTGSQWRQLVTASSMPAAFDFSGDGCYEIQVAPSNSSVMYMTFAGYVFKSANKGTTWTQTAFAGFNNSSDPANDGYRMNGQKMAIDPNNPNIVYVGTPSNGLYVTSNGGSTWSRVSAIPDANGEGITGILFDPAIGGAVSGVTQTIFASSYGNGVYESTDGGATWRALSGGPTDVEYAAVSSTGVYYAVGDGNSGLWSYANGTWTQLISGNNGGQGIQAVAVNPSNPNEIVAVSPAGYLNISYNAGAAWTGPMWSSNQVTSPDIPWLADANTASAGNTFLSVGGVTFNPTNPSRNDPHRRHRSMGHYTGADVGRDPEHASDLDRPNCRHRESGRR